MRTFAQHLADLPTGLDSIQDLQFRAYVAAKVIDGEDATEVTWADVVAAGWDGLGRRECELIITRGQAFGGSGGGGTQIVEGHAALGAPTNPAAFAIGVRYTDASHNNIAASGVWSVTAQEWVTQVGSVELDA